MSKHKLHFIATTYADKLRSKWTNKCQGFSRMSVNQ